MPILFQITHTPTWHLCSSFSTSSRSPTGSTSTPNSTSKKSNARTWPPKSSTPLYTWFSSALLTYSPTLKSHCSSWSSTTPLRPFSTLVGSCHTPTRLRLPDLSIASMTLCSFWHVWDPLHWQFWLSLTDWPSFQKLTKLSTGKLVPSTLPSFASWGWWPSAAFKHF